jgi:hypothetical protein
MARAGTAQSNSAAMLMPPVKISRMPPRRRALCSQPANANFFALFPAAHELLRSINGIFLLREGPIFPVEYNSSLYLAVKK